MQKIISILILLVFLVGGGNAAFSPTQKIPIGALFSISGPWSNLGKNSEAVFHIALRDVNTYLYNKGSLIRFRYMIEDTRLDPKTALEKLSFLSDHNVKAIIGPQSSSELKELAAYADRYGVVLISQSSTSHSLAKRGDNIFRICPDDLQEGKVAAKYMGMQGIKQYISLCRNDLGNMDLQISTRVSFEEQGGSVPGGIQYDTRKTSDFSAELKYVNDLVAQAIQKTDPQQVAVYYTGFDEAAKLLNEAGSRAYPALSKVRWFGGDGAALNPAILADSSAGYFAERVKFTCPLYGLDASKAAEWEPLRKKVFKQTGIEPDAYALSVYDALWIIARAYVATNGTEDAEKLKEAIMRQAYVFEGVTGSGALNQEGDRKYANYDFWRIVRDGDKYGWKKAAVFVPSIGGGEINILLP